MGNKRLFYVDNFRWVIVLTVIVYHVIYVFNSAGVISNVAVTGIKQMDVFLYFVYPWFMAVLFVAAGIGARHSLLKRGGKGFFRERVRCLLIPSVAGIFLLGWVSGWVTDQYAHITQQAGGMVPGIIKYLIYCMCGVGPLWFAQELFLVSIVLLLLSAADKRDFLWKLGGKVNTPVLFLLVLPVWGSSRLFITPVVEVYRNGFYLFLFLLGYYVFSHEEVTDRLARIRIPLLAAALACGAAYVLRYFGENYTALSCLTGFFTNFYTWLMILALLGCFKAWFPEENKISAYMRKRSFGFYVLHYPIIVLTAYLLTTYLKLPMLCNYLALLGAAAVLTPAAYECVGRIPLIRVLLLGEIDIDRNND